MGHTERHQMVAFALGRYILECTLANKWQKSFDVIKKSNYWKTNKDMRKSKTRVTSSNPRVTSSNLRVTSSNPQGTTSNPRVTS